MILFNGLGERTPSWAWVRGDVERQTRVCAFDRAGQGWSGKAPGRQDAHQLSADVHGLLAAANVPGPYVLAGHSVGGTYALAYAMDYPKDVAGVALLDSSTPYQFDLSEYRRFYSLWRRASALLPTLARAGVARVYSFVSFSSFPSDARRALRAFSSSPSEFRADRDEFAECAPSFVRTRLLRVSAEAAVRTFGRRWRAAAVARSSGKTRKTLDKQRSPDSSRRDPCRAH